jgi:hypothetical protein
VSSILTQSTYGLAGATKPTVTRFASVSGSTPESGSVLLKYVEVAQLESEPLGPNEKDKGSNPFFYTKIYVKKLSR